MSPSRPRARLPVSRARLDARLDAEAGWGGSSEERASALAAAAGRPGAKRGGETWRSRCEGVRSRGRSAARIDGGWGFKTIKNLL